MSSPVQESDYNTSPTPDPGTTHNNDPDAVATDSDSDTDNPEASVADPTNRPTITLKMLNLCKEFLIMIIIAVAYAALTNETPPKVSKSPAAYPFFPQNSIVTDWYRGQITEAIEDARSSDIAFVMFYAPWDAESQTARKQLEIAAHYMQNEVAFVAVNCWQPGSECKRQYSKVYKWPVLIAYPTHGRGIQYNGPLEAFHIIKFLQNVCKPILRPETIDELIGKHDTVVLAKINVLPGSYEYAVFYSTALRFLERDPFRDSIFAVIPQKSDVEPSISLHIWNGTIDFEGELTIESLTSWILKNSYQITNWAAPTGMKSLSLSNFMQPGPTLILFTPKNPLLQQIDHFDMLREAAYDYYNCANNSNLTIRQKLITESRLRNRRNYQKMTQKCHLPTVITNLPNIWTNNTDICNCVDKESLNKFCESTVLTSKPTIQKTVNRCRDFLLAQKHSPVVFESRGLESGVNITGAACASNSSLKFVAIDSLRFYQFAERLGVDLGKRERQKSGVVIVNEKMETHYVMTENVNSGNLRFFIFNFTQKTLPRSLQSKVHMKAKSDHVYPHLNCSKSSQFCVRELTSDDFLPTVLQPNKVVIVYYYSKQCAFCNGFAYMFLTAAKLLTPVKDITFVRIDGDSNLLPWEYTMESFPTILFFPSIRKSESRAFPRNLPITVPNLLGFILTNIDPILKLKTMWCICCQTKFPDEKTRCVTSLRMETLTIIGTTLREWRNSTRKQKVLYKLQVLRQLHLLFAHSPEETSKININLNKLRD
ncbi:thioredoxin domain-containing protein 11 [Tribolium madens]|uniref:thioredoxin domain-containing protein 11 n=1 Tax=Tribolium madens TaxID=41895 RepID=UPI001CF75028|nr:thioredoxin domain-containing protein 11 [Tribolium madens]